MVYKSLTNLETLGNLLQYIMLNILEISRFNIVGISCFKFNIVGIWPPGMMDHSVTWDYTPLHSRQSKSKFRKVKVKLH